MTSNLLLDLPIEIQRQILGYLYHPWHLCLKRVFVRSRWPLYQIDVSSRLFLSPLSVCHMMHNLATDAINKSFTRILDARGAAEYHSLLPRAKSFLHRVETVYFSSLPTLLGSGELYQGRLPALKAVQLNHLEYTSKRGFTTMSLLEADDMELFTKDVDSKDHLERRYHERLESQIQRQPQAWQWLLNSSLKLQWRDMAVFDDLQHVAADVTQVPRNPCLHLHHISFEISFQSEGDLSMDGFTVEKREKQFGA